MDKFSFCDITSSSGDNNRNPSFLVFSLCTDTIPILKPDSNRSLFHCDATWLVYVPADANRITYCRAPGYDACGEAISTVLLSINGTTGEAQNLARKYIKVSWAGLSVHRSFHYS